MDITIILLLTFLGLCFGSFAGAQVWRLRARQLLEDKELGQGYDKVEYKRLSSLMNTNTKDDRSRCLHCSHQLAWYDLLPLASWLSTGGKCRYCKKSIGYFEPLIEVGVATIFATSYLLWPVALDSVTAILQFVLWLVAVVLLAILFAYDSKWFLLPDKINFPLIAIAAVFAGLRLLGDPEPFTATVSMVGAIGIMSGLYFVLWLVSKGRWIGFGDVKLGIALGLLLGTWPLAFLSLFLANLIGCLVVIPGLLSKKLDRKTQVPFGPMLIAGFFVTMLWGQSIIDWYLSASNLLML